MDKTITENIDFKGIAWLLFPGVMYFVLLWN